MNAITFSRQKDTILQALVLHEKVWWIGRNFVLLHSQYNVSTRKHKGAIV